MALGMAYGAEIETAHKIGDLHVHVADNTRGYWSSWDLESILKNASFLGSSPIQAGNNDFGRALDLLATFSSRISSEWAGFQRVAGFEAALATRALDGDLGGQFSAFLEQVDAEGSPGVEPRIFLGLSGTDGAEEAGGLLRESLFRSLLEHGDASSRVVPLVSLRGFDWDDRHNQPVFEAASKYGLPIFINGPQPKSSRESVISNPWVDGCLAGVNTGVVGAVTPNLPRAAFETGEEEAFFERVDELMYLARDGLEAKRLHMQREMGEGRMPLTAAISGSLDGYFGAIGVTGVHEALLNLLGKGIESMQGKAVAYKLLEHMNERVEEFGEETGHPFCLEAAPSDGAPYRLAEIDKREHPDIRTSGVETPFYTNSTCLPVDQTDDLWDALEHQKKLQTLYSGVTIFNINLSGELRDIDGCGILTRRIAERFQTPCFAFSPPYGAPSPRGSEEEEKVHPAGAQEAGEYVRLEMEYHPKSGLGRGELEEVRLRRPYAVLSGW